MNCGASPRPVDDKTVVPAHDRITGNVSVRYVLDTFVAGHGPGAGVSSVALRNMAKGA
jgi:conjugal transfer pilus assembly protein TrbC